MRTYLETIIQIQIPFNEWIAIYIRIGQAINLYMRTGNMQRTNSTIQSYSYKDPYLVGDLARKFTSQQIQEIINQITTLFTATHGLPEPVLLFRAIDQQTTHSSGTIMEMNQFISTSMGLKIMDKFVGANLPNPEYDDDVWQRTSGSVFRILVPAGTKIIYVGGAEHEIILPPGRFQVIHNIRAEKKRYAEEGKIDVVDVIYSSF